MRNPAFNKDWNIITRTIVPVIWMPSLGGGIGSTTSVGKIFHFGKLPVNMQLLGY